MISNRIILAFLLCFAGSFSFAQQAANKTAESSYRAVHWNIYDGLSQGDIEFVLKDDRGFLWLGSNYGLNRFDGNLFKNYYHQPRNTHTIAGNTITGLVEDSLHNIWVGTTFGLSRYDAKADTFSNLQPVQNGPANLVTPFWATKDKLYALESASLITVYDIRSLKRKTLVHLLATDAVDYGPSGSYSVFDEGSNSVWILANTPNGGGLLQVSLSDKKEKFYGWACYLNIPHHDHSCEAMRYDRKRNAIWLNSNDGLVEFTLADKQFHHIDALNNIEKLKDFQRFVGISLDLQGRVWFASNPKGILIYDPSNQSVTVPFPKDSVLQQDISFGNGMIYGDQDGMVWCGNWTKKGFYQLIPYLPAIKLYTPEPKQVHGLGSNQVITVNEDGDHGLLAGTLGNLYRLDRKTDEVAKLDLSNFAGLHTNIAIPGFTDAVLGKTWISTEAGLFVTDLKTNKSRPVVFLDSLDKPVHIGEPRFFFPFKNNWLLAAPANDRLYFFEAGYKNLTARALVSISGNGIESLYTTSDNDHLVFIKRIEGAGNFTYSYHDGKMSRIHNQLDTLLWTSIFFNKKDWTYWVAAESRLFHFDRNFKVIHTYNHADGLPDLEIVGLIADNNGNIWFHTDRYIHQLNAQTGEVSTLAEKDGFEKQSFELIKFNYKDDNGDIYFPGGLGGSGFDRISPGKYTNPPSSIYLQSLEVNQKPFPLRTGINNLRELSLSYFENKITLETGIIDYYSKGASRMRYKLEGEGVNENWQYGPANYIIRFEGLRPGKYTLRMQASNAALQFNGPEKIMEIRISPPWWQTWWAWVIYVVLFAVSVYTFITYRSRKLTREKRVLEEKVTVRTKQLSEANKELNEKQEEIISQRDQLSDTLTDLKATQKQLIQSEKMASLGELTAGIAHEIQNPLNFINNFSEVSRELLEEMKEELDKGDTNEVRLIATDIEQNLGKINHHGKRADAIVKGMLQHSRVSTGHKEPTDINALADEYLRLSYHGLRANDKSFTAKMVTSYDHDVPTVNIIPQDIGRVLLNLFNNAFYAVTEKAKTAGNGYQPVVILNTKRKNDAVTITVSDNGNGIPQSIVDKIYQPFFTTKPTGQGTGLGLSLSYDIIKAHGGEIKVETKEGEGAEFIISLPA
jgi:signal transduction histidine kinase/ligand-binding sensor domain-containing protein